jgi:peptide/nickel transport system substrate-binding protein
MSKGILDVNFNMRHWVLGLATALALLAVACGGPAATSTPAPQATTPSPGITAEPQPTTPPATVTPSRNRITLVTQAEPDSLGTFDRGCSGNVPSMVCEEIASDPLTWIDSTTFEVVPLSGVEGWQQMAPNRWRFQLREGVTFHNGEPWNAQAAKLGIDILGDKATSGNGKGAYGFHGAIHAEVEGDYVVDVVCEVNCPIFPRTAMFTTFQAPAWYQSATEEERVRKTVGLGPYEIVEWRPGVEIVLRAFENYQPNTSFDSQAPNIPEARQVWRNEALVRASMVTVGEADWAVDIGFENIDNMPAHATGTNNEVYMLVADTIWHPELRKKDVRRALALAVDCETLMEVLYNGLHTCIGNISGLGTLGITEVNARDYGYDPAMARQLLEQAGYNPENDIRIHSRAGRVYRDIELWEAVIEMWREVGVTSSLQILEEAQATQYRRSGCGVYGADSRDCINRPPPGVGFSTHFYETASSNESLDMQRQLLLRNSCFNVNSRVCEPGPGGLQDRLEDAIGTPLGPERLRKMEELATYIHEEHFFLPFFESVTVFGMASDLEWTPRYDPRTRVNVMRFR